MFKEYVYKMLGVLYKIYMEENYKGFINMIDISKLLEQEDLEWVYESINYLEAMGFVKPINTIGSIYAKIMPKGIMFLDDDEELNIKVQVEPLLEKMNFGKIRKFENQINSDDILEERKELFELLKSIKDNLNENPRYREVLFDIDTLKSELNKLDPDKEIILKKIDALRYIEFLRPQVDQLLTLLNL